MGRRKGVPNKMIRKDKGTKRKVSVAKALKPKKTQKTKVPKFKKPTVGAHP